MSEQSEPRILKAGDPVKVRASGMHGLVRRITVKLRKWPVEVEHQGQQYKCYSPAELLYTGDPRFPQPCVVQQEASDAD